MRGELHRGGNVVESFRAAVEPSRLVQHYVAADGTLCGPSGRCFDAATERLLHRLLLAGVATEPADVASPDVRRLLAGLQAELNARYGPQDDGGAAWWAELRPEHFSEPNGAFIVARLDGGIVGCGGLRRYDDRTGELKRMYTAAPARGRGAARAVLRHLERCAADLGYGAVRLETGVWQPEAIALYEAEGYRPIANYGPYRDDPISRCFEKALPPR
jgi:GNAT superfamily N-acetyltransferase